MRDMGYRRTTRTYPVTYTRIGRLTRIQSYLRLVQPPITVGVAHALVTLQNRGVRRTVSERLQINAVSARTVTWRRSRLNLTVQRLIERTRPRRAPEITDHLRRSAQPRLIADLADWHLVNLPAVGCRGASDDESKTEQNGTELHSQTRPYIQNNSQPGYLNVTLK